MAIGIIKNRKRLQKTHAQRKGQLSWIHSTSEGVFHQQKKSLSTAKSHTTSPVAEVHSTSSRNLLLIQAALSLLYQRRFFSAGRMCLCYWSTLWGKRGALCKLIRRSQHHSTSRKSLSNGLEKNSSKPGNMK